MSSGSTVSKWINGGKYFIVRGEEFVVLSLYIHKVFCGGEFCDVGVLKRDRHSEDAYYPVLYMTHLLREFCRGEVWNVILDHVSIKRLMYITLWSCFCEDDEVTIQYVDQFDFARAIDIIAAHRLLCKACGRTELTY